MQSDVSSRVFPSWLNSVLNYTSTENIKLGITSWFLVQLWSTYRVHFCRDDHDNEIDRLGMYDSSNESSQRTE